MCPLRILLNDNLVYRNLRGMKRYFGAITAGVTAHFGATAAVYSPERLHSPTARHIPAVEYRHHQPLRLNQGVVSLLAFLLRPAVLFNAYYTSITSHAAQVFPLYDMTPERLPNYFSPELPGNWRFMDEKKRCLEHAALVLAISESSARDALDYYPSLDASKVVVTPLGVDTFFFAEPAIPPTPSATNGKPFFLFVGHRVLQKNFTRLLIAFRQSGLANDYNLRVISPGGFSVEELGELRDMRLQDCVHLFVAPGDSVLRESYRQAAAFIYPSLYEGFGLPILEAMASGTVVATSNASSMPEVGGDVALYFDPYDPESIADCLCQVTRMTREQRADRIARGVARARTFTWARCQQQTVEALERLM
jgi:glycosyltransferase involved in cell wall biosynthesis